jgi:hypothetical protein
MRNVVERDFATPVFAAAFEATVLDAVLLEALALWVTVLDALALVACGFAVVDDAPPELAWARAVGAAGRLTSAAMRQIRLTVFQLTFRAMYCASPRGFSAVLAVVRVVPWSVLTFSC